MQIRAKYFKEFTCLCCEQTKPIQLFKQYSCNLAYAKTCLDCDKEKEQLKAMNKRKCVYCKEIKDLCEYSNKRIKCKECRKKDRNRLKEHINRQCIEQRRKRPRETILCRIRHISKKKSIPFDLELSDIVIPEYCPVLGIKLEFNIGKGRPKDNSPSIDKIIPELGYTKNNIKIISYRANWIKNNSNAEELRKIADYIDKNTKTLLH